MAITYTFDIRSLIRETSDSITDAVTTIYYIKTGTDENGFTGQFHGDISFTMDQIDPEGFTAFSDLTEEQVTNWIEANYEEAIINEIIAEEIAVNSLNTTKVEVGYEELPWYVAPEPTDPVEP